MTIQDLYNHAPQSFVFIRDKNGRVTEYRGGTLLDKEIRTVKATSYPMFKSVLEVTLANADQG